MMSKQVHAIEEILISSDSSDDEVMILEHDVPGVKRNYVTTINKSKKDIPPCKVVQTLDNNDYLTSNFAHSSDYEIIETYVNSIREENKSDDYVLHNMDDVDNTEDVSNIGKNQCDNTSLQVEQITEKMEKDHISKSQSIDNINNFIIIRTSQEEEILGIANSVDSVDEAHEPIEIDISSDDEEVDEFTPTNDEHKKISTPLSDIFPFRGKNFIELYCANCDKKTRKYRGDQNCKRCLKELSYKCKICENHFETKLKSFMHLKKQCASKFYLHCPECKYAVTSESKLEAHIKKFHTYVNSKPNLKCKYCIKKFRCQTTLFIHEKTCPTKFYCKSCSFKTKNQASIKRHVIAMHDLTNGEDGYGITNGSQLKILDNRLSIPASDAIKSPKKIKESEKKEDDINTELLVNRYCTNCGLTFEGVEKQYKKQCDNCDHLLLFQCVKCDKQSKSYCGIYDHLKNDCIYSAHICLKCNEQFHKEDEFKKHVNVCKYRKCERCGFKSKSRTYFRRHMFQDHNVKT